MMSPVQSMFFKKLILKPNHAPFVVVTDNIHRRRRSFYFRSRVPRPTGLSPSPHFFPLVPQVPVPGVDEDDGGAVQADGGARGVHRLRDHRAPRGERHGQGTPPHPPCLTATVPDIYSWIGVTLNRCDRSFWKISDFIVHSK